MNPIIIIGAGLVGSSIALALHKAGFAVKLIDATPTVDIKINTQPDLRCSAIVPSSIGFFKQIGIWDDIQQYRFGTFKGMQIWHETASEKSIELKSQEKGLKELGFIIENSVMQRALNQALLKNEVAMIRPVKTEKITINEDDATVIYSDDQGNTISETAKLIIAADGGNSWVREHLGFDIKKYDYQQNAIVTYVRHQQSHHNIARQVFTPTGPVAFLPLYENNLSSIVWSADTLIAQELMKESEPDFNQKLTQKMGCFLGEITESGPRVAFPLQQKHVKEYAKSRVVLIGDAAHTVHPLAGQGLNLGFSDAQQLSEILIATQKKRRDIGAIDTLRKFERARKTKNTMMLAAIDFCHNGFRFSNEIVHYMTSHLFSLSNESVMFKRWLIEKASAP
jgi:2-octaprenylphenol hydroxylase